MDFKAKADKIAVRSRQKKTSCVSLRDEIEKFGQECYNAGQKAAYEDDCKVAHACTGLLEFMAYAKARSLSLQEKK